MSYKECKTVLADLVAEGKLSADQVKSIVEEVAARGEKAKLRGENGANVTQQEAARLADEEIRRILLRQRQIVLEKTVNRQFDANLKDFKNDAEGFKSILAGSLRVREGGKVSIASLQRSRASRAVAELDAELRAAGVYDLFKRKLLAKEVAEELGAWSKTNGKKPISGSEDALKIARVIREAQRKMMFEKNLYGADVRTLDDYITRQTHDAGKLQAAGYEKWRADVDPLIDKERMSKGQDMEDVLRGIYDGAASGVHLSNKVELDSGEVVPFIKRKGLAHGMSQERVFHLKDGAAWAKYNDLYGRSDLYDTVIRGLEHDGRSIVMLQKTGPRGGSWLAAKRDELVARNQGNIPVQDELKSAYTDSLIRQVDGSANLVKSHSIAKAYWNVKLLNSMHDLGAVLLSSLADVTNAARQLQQAGVGRNFMQLHYDTVANMVRRSGPGADRAIARMSSVGSESFIGNIFSRFWSGDALDGKMSRFAGRVMRLTGLPQWTAEGKQAVGEMLSNWLGHESHLPFEKLNAQMQNSFKEYGITPEYWNAIREHTWGRKDARSNPEYLTDPANYVGDKFVTADSVQRIPDATIRGFLEKQGRTVSDGNIARMRDEIQGIFDNYIVDNVNRSFIDQSVRGKAFRQGNLLRGTHFGEAAGLFWQYKSFAVEYITQALARETYGQGVEAAITKQPLRFAKQFAQITGRQIAKGEVPPIIKLMTGATLMGGFALAMSNLSKGQKTDFTNPDTLKAAFLKGGGLGMYGDFMFGNYDSYGNNFLTKVGGPSATRINDAVTLLAQMRDVETGKVPAQLEKVIENEVPFLNLFYTKFAVDYLFLHQLHESLKPGSLRDLEQRYQEKGKGFIVPPSEVIDYGGRGPLGQGISAAPEVPGRLVESVKNSLD
jgi:polyhydroxyalkanoate synthesis regulator phasin